MSVRKKKHNITVTLPYTILGLIAFCMLLTGCELHAPSTLTTNRVQVEEKQFNETVAVDELNDAALNSIADHYRKHGDGPLDLTITYDPKSRSSNAMHANDAAARLAKSLRQRGVGDVSASIVPVKDSGSVMTAMVSYTGYNALAPKDCGLLSGYENEAVEVEEQYRLGCTMDTLFARQIARPKDLKGQSGDLPTTDGRRASNILETYRSGVGNEPLDGESASE